MSAKLNNGNTLNTFQNPDKKPLEKLELLIRKDGVHQPVPALSQAWMEKRSFLEYEAPKINDSDGREIIGGRERWLELATYIKEDLKWLLRLRFNKFWSNVLYNLSIGDCLVSCLQELPTFYNLETFPNDPAMRELLETLRRLVFLTFARIVTSKESKDEFISHEAHGKLLYEKYLLTVPMMLDICQLYGRENGKDVGKILSTAMKLQPAYGQDLLNTSIYVIQEFKKMGQRFEDQAMGTGAIPLSERGTARLLTVDNLEDLVVYLLDISSNIFIFLDCFPHARDLFCNDIFVNEIVHLYSNAIPELYKRLAPLAHKDETVVRYTELRHRLDVTRIELLEIFRMITYHNIATILKEPNPSKVPDATKHVEQFINFLDKAVTEREFTLDYDVSYPIETDLDLVSQISPDVTYSDPVKYNFIKRSVNAIFTEHDRSKDSHPPPLNNSASAIASGSQQTVTIPDSNVARKDETTSGTTSKGPEELASLMAEVKDILCDLGEGFIEKCLEHYNYDVNVVINAVFENSLPENLKSLDRTLPYIPPDPAESSAAIDRVLGSERLNVFDNDEFDVMTRDHIDKSRVHKGKRKDRYKNFGQLLDDKSYRKETGDIYEKYSIIHDEYDDEYDDTYDGHDVGPRGVDEPLEVEGRVFTTPRVLRWNEKREADEEEDEEEDEDERNEGPSRAQNDRLNFVQDPVEMRARAEQRRLSKRGGGGGGGGGGAARGSKEPQTDVIEKPKGQGNDKNVLGNKALGRTKSKYTFEHEHHARNRNRRNAADHKKRQGMMP